MLQDIIDSKVDSSILSFFLVAPARSFSILEISKRLKVPHGKAARSLNLLAESGLLKSFAKKNKKYYIINGKNRLVPDIRRQFLKEAPAYQDELFAAIKKLGDVKAAFLSGLFTGQPGLPVDLLLVGRANLKKLSDFLKSAQKMMGQDINYSVMTVGEFELRRDTFDKFIKDIFDYPHLTVVDSLAPKKK